MDIAAKLAIKSKKHELLGKFLKNTRKWEVLCVLTKKRKLVADESFSPVALGDFELMLGFMGIT